jgi:hypothetical protein
MAHGYLSDGNRTGSEFEAEQKGDLGRQRSGRSRGESDRREEAIGGFAGENRQGRRKVSAHPDDHYLSWRERHMSELDRDYEEYCREREQRFHSDFDAWRRARRASPQPLRTGMTQTGLSADPTGTTQAEVETSPASFEAPDPMATATLGTSSRGRGRS